MTKQGRGSILRTWRIAVSIPESVGPAITEAVQMRLDGLPITGQLHELRILARDVQSGRVGSLVIPAALLPR